MKNIKCWMKKFMAAAVAAAGVLLCDAADLGDGLIEVPYLESTADGHQWVLTDFPLAHSDRIEVKFRVNTCGAWDSPGVFSAGGDRDGGSGWVTSIVLYMGQSGTGNVPAKLQWARGGWQTSGVAPLVATDCEVVIDGKNGKVYQDGVGYSLPVGKFEETAGPLAIFAYQATTGITADTPPDVSNLLQGRIYYCRIFDADGNLKHNLVPARNLNAATRVLQYGFYDTVCKAFYDNRGAQPFQTDPAYGQTYFIDRADYASDEAAGAALVELAGSTRVADGDVIEIASGTKTAPKVYSIAAPVVLASSNCKLVGQSEEPEAAVIDAGGVSSGVAAIASGVKIANLTVQNAVGYNNGTSLLGGGIALTRAGSVIRNCVVRGCVNSSASTGQKGLGGGVYLVSSILCDSVVSNCTVSGSASDEYCRCGGGVYIGADSGATGSVVSNCLIAACASSDSSIKYACGGGIYGANGASVLLVDSKISGSTTSAKGGGVYFYSTKSATVLRCELAENVLDSHNTSALSKYGTALATGGTALVTVRGCRIVRNRGEWTAGSSSYGGAVGLSTAGSVVEDCDFQGNVSSVGGAAISSCNNGGGFTVSNCVFRDNIGQKAGAITTDSMNSDLLVTDSYFSGNSSGTGYPYGAAANVSLRPGVTARFRNCLCTGNSGGDIFNLLANVGDNRPSFIFENCTIVNNTCTYQPAIWNDMWDSKVQPGDVHIKGCVSLFNGKAGFDSTYTDVTYSCYSKQETSDGNFANESNVIYDSEKPLFKDIAADDFRPAKGSQLCDVVPPEPWMGSGKRKASAPHDLGSGFAVKPVGSYGVAVERVNSAPRLYGMKADIGACEYFCPPGLVLLLK